MFWLAVRCRRYVNKHSKEFLITAHTSQMSDYEKHLLSYVESSKITTLSCGHVVPPSNLLAVPVVQTHSGTEFNFTFEKRNSEQMVPQPLCYRAPQY